MNDAVTGVRHAAGDRTGKRTPSASEKAIAELGTYFHGGRGKLRLIGFVCQVLVASTVAFTLISLIDLGSVLLHAILLVANPPLVGGDFAQRFVLNLPARDFIIFATDAFVSRVPFNATVSLLLTATAEIYWTKRRASRLMPPTDVLLRNRRSS